MSSWWVNQDVVNLTHLTDAEAEVHGTNNPVGNSEIAQPSPSPMERHRADWLEEQRALMNSFEAKRRSMYADEARCIRSAVASSPGSSNDNEGASEEAESQSSN